MPLIKCPKCSSRISAEQSRCPHCSNELPVDPRLNLLDFSGPQQATQSKVQKLAVEKLGSREAYQIGKRFNWGLEIRFGVFRSVVRRLLGLSSTD